VDVARDKFFLYGKKLEEARIASNLDRAQLSNVAIIEQAHLTDTTDLEERMGFVILAAIVGLLLGLVSSFALEFFNKALRTRRDVEVYLGAPVLAMIPDLRVRALPHLGHEAVA
jgi:capsular polysaccharide biosynthesis protein